MSTFTLSLWGLGLLIVANIVEWVRIPRLEGKEQDRHRKAAIFVSVGILVVIALDALTYFHAGWMRK